MPTELTDEMILQRFTQLQESNMNLIHFAIGTAVYILLLTIGLIVYKKRLQQPDIMLRLLHRFCLRSITTLLIVIGLFAAFFAVVALLDAKPIQSVKHRDEWHVVLTEIIDIERDTVVSDGETSDEIVTKPYYFAVLEGIETPKSITGRNDLRLGDKVYAVIDYWGDTAFLYNAEEYEYVGSRLKERNEN